MKTSNLGLNVPDFDAAPWHDLVNNNFQVIDGIIHTMFGITNVKGVYLNSTAVHAGERYIDPSTGEMFEVVVDYVTDPIPTTFSADRVAHPSNWLLIDASAALKPARYAPCVSAKISDVTLRASIEASFKMANWVLGNSIASAWRVGAYPAPTTMIGLQFFAIKDRTRRSRSALVPSVTTGSTENENCFLAFSRPAAAASLKERSPRPPMSYAIPMVRVAPCAGAVTRDERAIATPAMSARIFIRSPHRDSYMLHRELIAQLHGPSQNLDEESGEDGSHLQGVLRHGFGSV